MNPEPWLVHFRIKPNPAAMNHLICTHPQFKAQKYLMKHRLKGYAGQRKAGLGYIHIDLVAQPLLCPKILWYLSHRKGRN
jgi:hypothetical protein